MKNRTLNIGKYQDAIYDVSGAYQTPPRSVTGILDQLTVYTDVVNGNRKTPNPQLYVTKRSAAHLGKNKCRYTPDNNASYTINGVVSGVVTLPSFDATKLTAAYNKTLDSFNESVRGSLDLSIDTFQYRQTTRMVREVYKLSTYAKLLRELAWGKRATAKALGSLWLQYTYGWRPTVQTIYDLAETLVDPLSNHWGKTVLAQERNVYVQKGTITDGAFRYDYEDKESYRGELSCLLRPLDSRMADYAKFTSMNPVSIAWELLPYSFVVDWIYDIGGYLRNVETASIYGDSFVSGYYTSTAKIRRITRPVGQWTNGSWVYTQTANPVVAYTARKERVRLTSYPTQRKPVFQVNLGWRRLLSAASLLSQHLVGREYDPTVFAPRGRPR